MEAENFLVLFEHLLRHDGGSLWKFSDGRMSVLSVRLLRETRTRGAEKSGRRVFR